MQFTRFLRNEAVSVAEMAAHAAKGTAQRVAGREIVAIQDTSDLVLGGRRARAKGFGPVGRGGALGGLVLHPVLALDAASGALLGLVDVTIWNRDAGQAPPRRSRATAQKESQRWIEGTRRAGEVLAGASRITMVEDQEGDFYEQFARRPASVDLIVRACQDRCLSGEGLAEAGGRLFSFIDGLAEQGRVAVRIPAAPGRKARQAELALRFAEVRLRKPLHGAAKDLPETVSLTLVDVRETAQPHEGEAVHWRLLTTHAVTSLEEARRIVDLYRMRWGIEAFFRMLKTAGSEVEKADIGDPQAMINFVAVATVAAVSVMQLVRAREGGTGQRLTDTFCATDQPLLEALCTRLEGKTARQKNPHAKGTLAFAAWVIGRLGGWDGYYGKAGPRVMRRGLDDFHRIRYGATLRLHDV